MSRTRKALGGAASGMFGYVLQVSSQVLVIPLVLAIAGQEAMGAYAALTQLISYLGLIDIGFGSAAYWYLASASGRDDNGEHFRFLLAKIRSVLFIVNTGFAILVLIASTQLHLLLSLSGTTALRARYGLYLLAIWALAKAPLSTYALALRSSQYLAEANVIAIVGNVVRLGAILPLLNSGLGVLGLIVANLLGDIITTAAQGVLFMRRCPTLRPRFHGGPPILREMFAFGAFALVANSGHLLALGTDNLVVSKLFGPASAAVYYATYAPAQVVWQTLFRIPASAGPGLAELSGAKNHKALADVYLKLMRYGILVSVPAALCLLGLHQPVISIWVGAQQYAGQLMTVSLALFIVLALPNAVCGTILTSMGVVRRVAAFVFAEGIVNLILSLSFASLYGFQGVAMGTAAAAVLFCPIYLWSANVELRVGNRAFFSNVLRPLVAPLCIAVPGGILLALPSQRPISFSIGFLVFLCGAWFGSAFYSAINAAERKWLWGLSGRVIAVLSLR